MDNTSIQWADSTTNPSMGCGGCELFRSPAEITAAIDAAVAATGSIIDSRRILRSLIRGTYDKIPLPASGHRDALTTTNIWHVRKGFADIVLKDYGASRAAAALKAIASSVTCYAAQLHLVRGTKITNPDFEGHKGYAKAFESVTKFPGRMANTAKLRDLYGQRRFGSPWKDGLPRLIFVSDMGDSLSSKGLFSYLENEVSESILTPAGRQHLWLWLTKRPAIMAAFAQRLGGFPSNVVAMTTVTGMDSLTRIDDLRKVNAACRGLSVEPLRERLVPGKLDLRGIHWLILGGGSGSRANARPFHLEWAEELIHHCHAQGVAVFVKQLGSNPIYKGKRLELDDRHGGEWHEWPKQFCVREFPEHFRIYRQHLKSAQ